MYLFDFFKNLVKKSNIGIIIYLILNTLLIVALFSGGFQSISGIFLGLGIYVVSLMIALSPIGEWILRMQNGCKEIKDGAELERLTALFKEVYAKAKAANPELPDNIKMFVSDSEDPNAFATGRKTVCVTRGLLTYSDEQIKGVLAHEFGHLAHKDTDTILVVAVGNLIVSAIFVVIRVVANIMFTIGQIISAAFSDSAGGTFAYFFTGIGKVFANVVLAALMWIWTKIGVLLCMHSSRKNEFEADAYAAQRGYAVGLCEVLESFGTGSGKSGLFAALAASHPETSQRVAKLRQAETAGMLNK